MGFQIPRDFRGYRGSDAGFPGEGSFNPVLRICFLYLVDGCFGNSKYVCRFLVTGGNKSFIWYNIQLAVFNIESLVLLKLFWYSFRLYKALV